MRKTLALTCLLALALAACGKKAENAPTAVAPNAPAVNAVAPAANAPVAVALPALPSLSPDACALLATYVKVELKGDFGLPVMMRIPPDKRKLKASDIKSKLLGGLKYSEFMDLENGLARSLAEGSQLDCDWKALGLEPPRPVTAESNASFRLRPIVAGDLGLLETYTEAGTTTLGGRCLYRKKAGAWVREKCTLTALD